MMFEKLRELSGAVMVFSMKLFSTIRCLKIPFESNVEKLLLLLLNQFYL